MDKNIDNNDIKRHLLEKLHILYLPKRINEKSKINKNGLISAQTNIKNIESLGYTISKKSFEGFVKFMSFFQDFNLFDEINTISPKPTAKPMYPDFPSQVMKMGEAEYRCHQYLHYLSTYGVEEIGKIFGFETRVGKGWLPDVEDTPKIKDDTSLVAPTALDIVFNKKDLDNIIYKQLLCRKERLNSYDLGLLDIISDDTFIDSLDEFTYKDITFHENLYPIIARFLFSSFERDKKIDAIYNITQHVGDIAKFICDYRSKQNKHWRFTTHEKKVLGLVIIRYFNENKNNFQINLEDNRRLFKAALHTISFIKHFKGKIDYELADIIFDLMSNKLSSWASKKEESYKYGDIVSLFHLYRIRPGILVRELKRFITLYFVNDDVDIKLEDFEQKLRKMPFEQLSIETLLNVINDNSIWEREWKYEIDDNEKELIKEIFVDTLNFWIESILSTKFSTSPSCDILPKDCTAIIDTGKFNLEMSTISTNKSDVGTYLKSGMAVHIPKDAKKIRFFVFWDNKEKRVDLDLHSFADNGLHVGWFGDFDKSGITTSGDITHSENACEYIDIDIEKAKQADIHCIQTQLNSFTCDSFCDIDKAFCGVLAVDNSDIDTKIYNSKNVLNRVDLTQSKQTNIYLASIDLDSMTIIYHMQPRVAKLNGGAGYAQPNFSVMNYINTLVKSRNLYLLDINLVNLDSLKNKDKPVITLDKSKKHNSISLIDNNWFL